LPNQGESGCILEAGDMKLSLKESTQSGRGSVFRDDYRRWETLTETTPTKKNFAIA